MFGRGWWIALAGVAVAIVLSVVFAMRGPASGRAPSRHAGGTSGSPRERADEARVRVSIAVLPEAGQPAWTLAVRDAAGGFREEAGTGEDVRVIGPLPPGRLLLTVRAPGFLGSTCRVEAEGGREAAAELTLCQLGSVSGVVRSEGVPLAGVLVQLAMPADSAAALVEMSPEDRPVGTSWSVESDGAGRFRFDRLPPARGFTAVAADFDHPPTSAGPIEVGPGETTTVDFALTVGAHLAGRIVDYGGAPCRGATVHVLEQQPAKRHLEAWADEAQARTDEEGRFVTPALGGPALRMLKAWIVVDGVQQVIQHETAPPERGTKDVGTLAPYPGIVLFEVEGAVGGDATYTLTVGANGDPPGAGQSIALSGALFGPDGRIRLAGLPIGEGFYSVLDRDGRAVANGTFRTTGADIVVRVPPFGPPAVAPSPSEGQLVVEVADTGDPALLLLLGDGSCVLWRRLEKGKREPVVGRVSPGRYTLLVSSGDRFAQQEIEVAEERDTRVSIVPDRPGRSVSLLVLDEGMPVPGATVAVRGFRGGAKGARAPWAEAGDDGRAALRGLPPDLVAMTVTVLAKDGSGRSYTIDVEGADEVTVDLAKGDAGH